MDTKTHRETEIRRDIPKEMEELEYDSIIDYLMDFPLQIENVEFLTREEVYSGKRFQ